MNLIIWLVVGGLIGWVASLIMKTDAQQGLFLNVVVGIVGALIGAPLARVATVDNETIPISPAPGMVEDPLPAPPPQPTLQPPLTPVTQRLA